MDDHPSGKTLINPRIDVMFRKIDIVFHASCTSTVNQLALQCYSIESVDAHLYSPFRLTHKPSHPAHSLKRRPIHAKIS